MTTYGHVFSLRARPAEIDSTDLEPYDVITDKSIARREEGDAAYRTFQPTNLSEASVFHTS